MNTTTTLTQRITDGWMAQAAHVARLVLADQGIRNIDRIELTLSGMRSLREAWRACTEGRLRLAVLCFVSAYCGDVFVAARHKAYVDLPMIPEHV